MDLEAVIKSAVLEAIRQAPVQSEGPRLITIESAAEYLSCSPNQVRALISRGVLPVVTFGEEGKRSRVYIDRQDLDRAIEQNKSHAA